MPLCSSNEYCSVLNTLMTSLSSDKEYITISHKNKEIRGHQRDVQPGDSALELAVPPIPSLDSL